MIEGWSSTVNGTASQAAAKRTVIWRTPELRNQAHLAIGSGMYIEGMQGFELWSKASRETVDRSSQVMQREASIHLESQMSRAIVLRSSASW
jgi:hypothetical protein